MLRGVFLSNLRLATHFLKSYLSCHSYVSSYWVSESILTIEVTIAMPADGPSLGVAPSGTCTCISYLSNKVGIIPNDGDLERTKLEAASILSFMTSPSFPVDFILPFPGNFIASIERRSPPTSVHARPVATPI